MGFRVGEEADPEHGVPQGAAVEEVEDLKEDDGRDDHRLGFAHREARLVPESEVAPVLVQEQE